MDRSLGIVLVVAGCIAVAVGLLAMSGALSWFGRLPGDLRFEGQHSRIYVPITSMLLVSVVGSILLSLLSRR